MLILIAGYKGGTGKSTLCLLLANYLSTELSQKVTVIDFDSQHPLSWKAQRAKRLSNKPPYQVIAAEPKDFPGLIKALDRSLIILVELPGKMYDDQLLKILTGADLVLCPFGYDELSVDATVLFAMVIRRINFTAPLVFVPNKVKHTLRHQTGEQVRKVLKKFGVLVSPLADRIDFQRVSTFHTPENLLGVVGQVMEEIYLQFIKKQPEAAAQATES